MKIALHPLHRFEVLETLIQIGYSDGIRNLMKEHSHPARLFLDFDGVRFHLPIPILEHYSGG
jgi:hypothetical protein